MTLSAPRPTPKRDAMLLMLTWAAGSMDAISYLGLGHVFTAMMTGNTVLLGLALAEGEVRAVLRSAVALAGFAVGAAAGAWVADRNGRREEWPHAVTRAFMLESGFLVLFTAIWYWTTPGPGPQAVSVLILLSSVAMGIQAAAVRRIGVPGIATTYITGTLTSLMGDLIAWLRSIAPGAGNHADAEGTAPLAPWEQRVGLLAAVFLVYGLGAMVGAALQSHMPRIGTLTPLVAVVAVVVTASLSRER